MEYCAAIKNHVYEATSSIKQEKQNGLNSMLSTTWGKNHRQDYVTETCPDINSGLPRIPKLHNPFLYF